MSTSHVAFDTLSLDGERVMLIGGAGFIGHHLALALHEKGAETMVVDNLQINNLVGIVSEPKLDPTLRALYTNFVLDRFALLRDAGIPIENVDCRIMADLAKLFSGFEPTKIVHLAAISSAVTANKVPGLAYDIQINSLRLVLELCQMSHSKVNQICFMSSSTVYGDFEGDSVDETIRPRPRGVYANGKYMGERMVREAKMLNGLAYTIVRPSALYGIRCVSRRVSQVFIENALSGKSLLLEGGGDGQLDFTHIDDLVEGIVRALALEGGLSRTFNITFGNARTIADLAGIVREYFPKVKFENRPRAKEKPKRGTLQMDRAREFLGFVPNVSLDIGYRKYCEWYIEQWERVRGG